MTAVVCIVLVALVAIKDKAARALRNELEEARIENARLKEKLAMLRHSTIRSEKRRRLNSSRLPQISFPRSRKNSRRRMKPV